MIEKIIREYLKESLDVPVFMEKPKEKPESFVTIERTGGPEENHIYHSTIVIDSYDTTLAKTVELNRRVTEAMLNSINLSAIGSCKLNSTYNDTDTATKEYRYGALFDLTHY